MSKRPRKIRKELEEVFEDACSDILMTHGKHLDLSDLTDRDSLIQLLVLIAGGNLVYTKSYTARIRDMKLTINDRLGGDEE